MANAATYRGAPAQTFRLDCSAVPIDKAGGSPVLFVQTVHAGCDQLGGVLNGSANYSTLLTLGATALKLQSMYQAQRIASQPSTAPSVMLSDSSLPSRTSRYSFWQGAPPASRTARSGPGTQAQQRHPQQDWSVQLALQASLL